eukprot:3729639-Prymnesium_polylepis.1
MPLVDTRGRARLRGAGEWTRRKYRACPGLSTETSAFVGNFYEGRRDRVGACVRATQTHDA